MAEIKAEKAKQIVLVMVGPPGSGKTTFCYRVMGSSRRPWSHVSQPTINNGLPGTTAQSLNMARNSLTEGKNVLIDRCNIMKELRSELMSLRSLEVEVHAVVLEFPAQVCISRKVTSTGPLREAQRISATISVDSMFLVKELPKVEEGFSRIMFCYNDKDVENAVNIYNRLGPDENLPSGCFGLKDSDSKINAPPGFNAANTTPKTNKRTTTVRDTPSADKIPKQEPKSPKRLKQTTGSDLVLYKVKEEPNDGK